MTPDATWQRADTTWLREARWGVFLHYLAAPPSSRGMAALTAEDWNTQVDGFDADGLAAQLASIAAPYVFLTIGQNTGFFCAPNETYDSLVPNDPTRLSRRDLVADLAAALRPHGIRLLVYLPAHAPAEDLVAVRALRCTPPWDGSAWQLRPDRYEQDAEVDERLTDFQRHWEAIIREWSLRWGRSVHGWWIDGCYHADRMYRHPDPPNFRSFAEAMKAGNPDSLVAFNPGVKVPVVCHSEYEDYTAGEIANALPLSMDSQWHNPDKPEQYWGMPLTDRVDGAQFHILTFLGWYWCGGDTPRFCDDMVAGITRHINAAGGAVTWDVPIGKSGPDNGLIPPPFLSALGNLSRRLRGSGESPL